MAQNEKNHESVLHLKQARLRSKHLFHSQNNFFNFKVPVLCLLINQCSIQIRLIQQHWNTIVCFWHWLRDSGNDFHFPDFVSHTGHFRLIFVRISSVVSFWVGIWAKAGNKPKSARIKRTSIKRRLIDGCSTKFFDF